MTGNYKQAADGSDSSIDPVCGMTVSPNTAAGSFEHNGQQYYFCSAHCLEKFQSHPESFLNRTASPMTVPPVGIQRAKPQPTTTATGKTTYTCPMHPEIVRNAPGSCPICGMALEPRTVSLDEEENPELTQMSRRFWVCVGLWIPLLIIGMSELIPSATLERVVPMGVRGWIELGISTPVVLWGALPFFERAWQSLVNRALNMFTLIGVGVGVAYLFSVIAKLFPKIFPQSFRDASGNVPVYFEAAAVITTLVLLGQVLELRARSRTGAA